MMITDCPLKRGERNSIDMSTRCAVCGSKNVVKEFKKEGYDVKKGVIGTVLVGAPGALAGAGGKDVTYYHCADCGQVMNRPMYDNESNFIDDLIANPNLFPDILREKKARYKNIEWEEKTIDKRNESISKEWKDEREINKWMDRIVKKLQQTSSIKVYEIYKLSQEDDLNIVDACRRLKQQDIIVEEEIDSVSYFRLLTDLERANVLEHKKNEKQKILNFLTQKQDYFTISEMINQSTELAEYTTGQLLTFMKALEKENKVEVKVGSRHNYYAIAGLKEKLEKGRLEEEKKKYEEQRRIQRENINKKIKEEEEKYNKELETLQKQLSEQEAIFEANKSKIFGEGAKAKKEAKQQIEYNTNQIQKLKSDYMFKKISLQDELQKL